MKKITALTVVLLFALQLTACGNASPDTLFPESFGNEQVFADNIGSLNSNASVCLYENYYVAVKHVNFGNTDRIIMINKKDKSESIVYDCGENISSIKPISNNELCVITAESNLSYINLNLVTGEASEVFPDIDSNNTVIRLEPYFLEETVFLDMTAAVENEGEPIHEIYAMNGDGAYSLFVENCSQFQIVDNGIVYEYAGRIYSKTADGTASELLDFNSDSVFSALTNKYLVSVGSGYYEIIDVFTGDFVCDNPDISFDNSGGIEGLICAADNFICFSTYEGIEMLDLNTGEVSDVCSVYPDTMFILDNQIFFKLSNTVFSIDPNNSQIQIIS